jgi:mycothiol synthase
MGACEGGYRGRVADIRDATLADAGPVFDLLAARSRAAFGMSELARAQFDDEFRRNGADRFVVDHGVELLGYAHLAPGHEVVIAAEDAAVSDELLRCAEERARARGFASVEITAVREDVPLWELVERSGFEHTHDVLRMWRVLDGDLPDPRWPNGVAVRTYLDADAESVHGLLDTCYSAWDPVHVPLAHDAWVAFMTDHTEFDPQMWFLVEREDELVACALHWKEHQGRGWVKDIVVREDERGRGIAKALLHHGFREYAARRAGRVGLKVETSNPTGAVELYERVGFEIDRRYAIWVKRL